MNRHLYRCRTDRRVAGVAAGVAEFFELDPTLVRVLWFVSIFFGGISLLVYIGLAIIVPLEPLSADAAALEASGAGAGAGVTTDSHRHVNHGSGRWTTIIGLGLVLIGSLALIDVILPSVDTWRYLGPALIIGLGALLVGGAIRRRPTES